jgi:pSer/pThr/pTyr-binding forkhead associated (FHA) protein
MAAQLRFRVIGSDRSSRKVKVDGLAATLGARADNAVVLDDGRVSGRHATFRLTTQGVQLIDSSTNGCFVRGERVRQTLLVQGEVVTIAPFEVEVRWRLPPPVADGTLARLAAAAPRAASLEPLQARGGSLSRLAIAGDMVLVGAGGDAQARLSHPSVSTRHAELTPWGELLKVRDLDSTNGTYVNGVAVGLAFARPGDALAFGPDAWFVYRADSAGGP